jgi:hypothetical protein
MKRIILLLMLLTPLMCLGQTDPHWLQIAGAPLVDVRTLGAKPDDGVDDTISIATGLNTEPGLFFPGGTFDLSIQEIDGLVLRIPSNKVIVMSPDTVLKLGPHNTSSYNVLRMVGASNVTILGNGATVNCNKDGNSATTGEQGHGLFISSSNNINISGLNIENAWGDGMYFTSTPQVTGDPSHNVSLENISIDGCRRQGITIIKANDTHLRNIRISNIAGTPPEAGIDFEPNYDDASDSLWGITLDNVTIDSCVGEGINFGLRVNPSKVNVVGNGVRISNCATGVRIRGPLVPLASGIKDSKVVFNDLHISDITGVGVQARSHHSESFPIILNRAVVHNANSDGLGGGYEAAAFGSFRTNDDALAQSFRVGNMHVINPIVKGDNIEHVFNILSIGSGTENVSLIDPIAVEAPSLVTENLNSFVTRCILMGVGWGFSFSNRFGALPLPEVVELNYSFHLAKQNYLSEILRNISDNGAHWGYKVDSWFVGRATPLTLSISDGITLSRPVICQDLNIPWVTLTSGAADKLVEVDGSALDYSFATGGTPVQPFFGFSRCNGPRIIASFTFDASAITAARPTMIAARKSTLDITGNITAVAGGTASGTALLSSKSTVGINGDFSGESADYDIQMSEGSIIKASTTTTGQGNNLAGATISDNTVTANGILFR